MCGICIGRVGFGSSRCSEGLLGRYGHWGSNQRPWAEATDGTSRARAVAVSRSHRRGREWPTPSNKKIRCRQHGPVLLIGAASPTAKPATDPPTSRPTYPRDREVPLACLVGEPYARVRYPRRRCVVGVGTSSACLIQHSAQDTGASWYTPTGGRCSPVTSCDQTVVFATHVYKNAL